MKRVFFLLFAVAFLAINTAMAYDFSAIAPSGQTLYYEINGNGNSVTLVYPSVGWDGYNKPTGTLIIPSSVTYNGVNYPVFCIGKMAFHDCFLDSIGIPNSVIKIEESAMGACVPFSLYVPNSVTCIENDAFIFVRNVVYYGNASGSPWGALSVNGYVEGDLVYSNSSKTFLKAC